MTANVLIKNYNKMKLSSQIVQIVDRIKKNKEHFFFPKVVEKTHFS